MEPRCPGMMLKLCEKNFRNYIKYKKKKGHALRNLFYTPPQEDESYDSCARIQKNTIYPATPTMIYIAHICSRMSTAEKNNSDAFGSIQKIPKNTKTTVTRI
jgi:hypothetical protein